MVSQPKLGAILAAPSSSSKQPLQMQSSLVIPEPKLTGIQYDAEGLLNQSEGMQLERHSDLWFDDGSVICQAEDTLFKVHMSQLARHSVCFRDMFSLPQPVSRPCSSTDLASTCTVGNPHQSRRIPVIQLHDTAEDVGNLLTALYDGPCVDCLSASGEINSNSAHKVISEITVTKTFEAYLGFFVYRQSTLLILYARKHSRILVLRGRLI
jgi:hypothetical protein